MQCAHSFLITEYDFTRAYFLEGPAGVREGAPMLRAEVSPDELDAIRKIPDKADRATAIGEFIKTKGTPVPTE